SKFKHTTMDALQNMPLIMLTQDTQGRRFADRLFKSNGIEPNIVMEPSTSEEVKRMVEIDLGVAIVSKLSITDELRRGTLHKVKVNELALSHPVGVVYKSGRYINSAMQQFLSVLKRMPEDQFVSSE